MKGLLEKMENEFSWWIRNEWDDDARDAWIEFIWGSYVIDIKADFEVEMDHVHRMMTGEPKYTLTFEPININAYHADENKSGKMFYECNGQIREVTDSLPKVITDFMRVAMNNETILSYEPYPMVDEE